MFNLPVNSCYADEMTSESTKGGSGGNLMAWLQLMRLPTVFTALSNILCGYFIATIDRDLATLLAQKELWLLLASSAGLYLGGMVLNDVFDVALDSVERPNRPIPSGRISRRAATLFGFALMMAGIVCATVVGTASTIVAVMIAVAVLLYDGFLKNTPLAPIGMATCRFLNLILGSSAAAASFAELWEPPAALVALPLGVYVFGVTLFAQNEAGNSSRTLLYAGLLIALLGISGDALVAGSLLEENEAPKGALIALSLIAANVALRAVRAINAGQPILLQKTVGFMLLNVIFIDAAMTFCCTESGRLATLVVVLVVPATLSKRLIRMS